MRVCFAELQELCQAIELQLASRIALLVYTGAVLTVQGAAHSLYYIAVRTVVTGASVGGAWPYTIPCGVQWRLQYCNNYPVKMIVW